MVTFERNFVFITRKSPVFTSQVIYRRERKGMGQHVLEADRDDMTERSMPFCAKSHRVGSPDAVIEPSCLKYIRKL